MRCPSCDQPGYHPAEPCHKCQFSGDPALIEELAHVGWLLGEMEAWVRFDVNQAIRRQLRAAYLARQREIEIALELRPPPFTDQEARRAWPVLFRREALGHKMSEWSKVGLLGPDTAPGVREQIADQVDEMVDRLVGRQRPDYPATDADRLDLTNALLDAVDALAQRGCFVTPVAEAQARAPFLEAQERLQIMLGLRPRPEPEKEPSGEPTPVTHEVTPEREPPVTAEPPAPPEPPAPLVPFRERLWRSLVSERTLRAILFLGIFLLFAAAISFVVWGWRDFTPLLRVAIPTGFTALFFLLGWYVRTRMALHRSGIALSAIASLLIPIDFYTAFVNLDIPADYWPEFWLVTSLFCLGAYVIATLSTHSRLFGYLVGVAAGSIVLSVIEVGYKSIGLSRDWYTAGLSVLAVGLVLLGTAIARRAKVDRWHIFADPFRYLALLTAGVLMPLTFGWRFIDREAYDALHYALTINWWLGGLIFGWGAVYHRSRSLGLMASISLPVATYLAQAAAFDRTGVNPAWHAFGWACLVPLYFVVGRALSTRKDDPVIRGHGRTATGWGIALLVTAALWSFTDLTSGAAAAGSHTVLAGAVVLAALLWRRPGALSAASLLLFSAATFAMAESGLTIPQLSIGWASLAIAHVVIAFNLGRRASDYAPPLVSAGYAIAALALLPPLLPYNGKLLAYALGNWIGLAAWGARLAHVGQPGFIPPRAKNWLAKLLGPAPVFHWLAALPLPFWLWISFVNRRPPDAGLSLALAALSWGMVALSHRLARSRAGYRLPWYLTGLLVSVAAPITAFAVAPGGLTPALCLLSTGLLAFTDAIASRHAVELMPAGVVTAWGYILFLHHMNVSVDTANLALSALIALYLLSGLWAEWQKSHTYTRQFLTPLYLTAHALTLIALARIYLRPIEMSFTDQTWTDGMRLWGAAAQLVLGIVYGLYAWGTYRERWGHAAAWLGAAGGGFLFTVFSRGRGSSAAKVALMAIFFVLTERSLRWLFRHPALERRRRAFLRLAWHLYRRPLLVTGWIVSVGVIALALIRNMWLLGGGRTQQTWAAIGLLLIVGLYALSARLFRRARFVWLAAMLAFAPWTILSNLGWFTALRPTPPGFAISWMVLAWTLFLLGLLVKRLAPHAYALPLRVVSHLLVPFSLLWGVADVDTGRFTFGLAVCLYGTAAWLDGRRYRREGRGSIVGATAFRYPALGLIPVWCVYLIAWWLPTARHEHYGLMFLAFGPLGLITGRWLLRPLAPRHKGGESPDTQGQATDAGRLPAYLTGYVSLVVGTMLVAHSAPLLAMALLFDAALMLVSARLFRNPLWVYSAAVMAPISLLISLHESSVPGNRHGWWLIGLAAVYLTLAWLLRRVRLEAYGTAALTAAFALTALGLPPSSRDQTGALWGYGSAALLYAIAAFWLRQPLLLTPASALSIVPYAIGLQRSALVPAYYGLALLPGATIALALGHVLDVRLGGWRDFPWVNPARWPIALADRLLGWWGLPLYTLGLGLATTAPFYTDSRAGLSALNWALLALLYTWAIYRFRLRGWLLAMGLAGHLATFYYLDALGWWAFPDWGWLWFSPMTVGSTLAAFLIERRRREGSPLHSDRVWRGWSRPLYLLALADVVVAQTQSLGRTGPGAAVSLIHALLLAVLASAWQSPVLSYVSAALGVLTLWQWLAALAWPAKEIVVAAARLALGYGLAGYGLALLRRWSAGSLTGRRARPAGSTASPPGTFARLTRVLRVPTPKDGREEPGPAPWLAVWERPLQRSSLLFSWVILAAAGLLGLDVVGWTVRAMLGLPFREIVDLETVRMAVGVLSLLGLLYVAAAVVYRRLWLGYTAGGALLASWMFYAFYIQRWDGLARVQWYAIPAGLYLLGIAYLEWRRGNRLLARWLDYAATLLMIGSLFWQTLIFGWQYALLLGAEGFTSFWWGSARRLRRFFYAGMVGVILATLGQLINSLQSINQWIVFGTIGLLLIIVATLVERKLETIRSSLQEVLEDWE